MTPRQRLSALGFDVPPPAAPKGAYFPSRRCGDQLWISGATARRAGSPALRGVVGADVTLEQAVEQARLAAVNLLGAIEGRSVWTPSPRWCNSADTSAPPASSMRTRP